MNHRWVARGVVVGLHLAVLLALWLHRPAPLPDTSDRRLTTVRIIPPTPERRPRVEPPDIPLRLPVIGDLFPVPPPPPVTAEPQAPAPESTQTAPPATPVEAPRTTLRLTLPPGYAASANAADAARNPALRDPRSNTPRATLEDRIADATGGAGAWVEEPTSENRLQSVGALGEYRTVMRRGDTCVEIFRSRISDSDPFNANVAPRAPTKMVGKPYKCK